jgi:hypothetical protein
MTPNIQFWDRLLRYFFGIVLLTLALAGGPTWSYVGAYLLITASFGRCAIYWLFRINSRA